MNLRYGRLLSNPILWVLLTVCALPTSAQISVTSANPNNAPQGATNLIVKIGGNGFKRGASSKFFVTGTTNPGGITVNSTAFVNSSEVDANITVAADAAISGFDIQVTAGDRTGKGTDLFAVLQGGNRCTDISLALVVAPQTAGQGGISGDGLFTYNNPNDPVFNGGTLYEDGLGGASVKFLVCGGSNDFVVNLRSTSSPVRFLNFDFSTELYPADTLDGAVDLSGRQIQQQGQQINEMANFSLYSNGQFLTCSGISLNPLSSTVTAAVTLFHPTTLYDPVVPDCNGGTGPDLANQPINTSEVQVQQVDACTWTVSPLLDSTGAQYRAGVYETVKVKGKTSLVAGGQYQMPFHYKIQKLNCTP